MLKFILYALLAWFLYNLVFRFIIPLYKASRQMKKQFRQMHEQFRQAAEGRQGQQHGEEGSYMPKPGATSPPKGDYLEFEEITDDAS